MRSIALDVHRDFCEVAIKDGAEVRAGGRIKTSTEELERFARSLASTDQVALEATEPALQIDRPAVGVSCEDNCAGAVNVLYGGAAGLSATGNQSWHQNSSGVLGTANVDDSFGFALAAGGGL